MARLSDSVPDDVKIISFGDTAPRAAATCFLAVSIAVRTRRPGSCIDDGLPYDSSRYGIIADRTEGAIFVVAALSA